MGIFRKENGVPVPKAGFTGTIDNILNKFSNNAVSNKAVTEEIDRINADLADLAEEVSKMGLPKLNYTTPLHNFNSSLTYTAVKDCYLVGMIGTTSTTERTVTVNGTIISSSRSALSGFVMLRLSAGDIVTCNESQKSLNVLEEASA